MKEQVAIYQWQMSMAKVISYQTASRIGKNQDCSPASRVCTVVHINQPPNNQALRYVKCNYE